MNHSANKKLIKKRDAVIILIILIIGIMSFTAYKLFSEEGRAAVVSVDGNIIEILSLTDSVKTDITVNGIDGVLIDIKNGRIKIKSSECPDKICVNTGYISKVDERIVCLPKKLIIEIRAEE